MDDMDDMDDMDETSEAKGKTSDARIAANRRNAQRSTGPRTQDGKARSSRNALKHGAYAREHLVIEEGPFAEDPEEIGEFIQAIIDSLDPRDALEEGRAARIAHLSLQGRRLDRWEASMLESTEADGLQQREHLAMQEEWVIDQLREWNGTRFEVDRAKTPTAKKAKTAKGTVDASVDNAADDRPWELMAVWLRAFNGNKLTIRNLWDATSEPSSPEEWKRALATTARHYYPDPVDLGWALVGAVAESNKRDAMEAHNARLREARSGLKSTDTVNAQRSRITSELMKQLAMYNLFRSRRLE